MEKFSSFLMNLKSLIIGCIVFLFPLFFLPLTQEFFVTNKMYLLAFGSLLLFLVSTLEFLVSRKIRLTLKPLDRPVALFVIAVILSVIISSPNKIQAILNPNFGPLILVSLAILYYYISREKSFSLSSIIYHLSSCILSLTAIVFFFHPFKTINPGFTPIGSQLDLVVFLGAFILLTLVDIIKQGNKSLSKKIKIMLNGYLVLMIIGFLLTLYSLLKSAAIVFPPLNISWYAAVEIFKNPLTAFFGVGIDNFSSIFTRLKDLAYDQSPLWQINSFSVSRSAVLQIITETGLLGTIGFGIIMAISLKIIAEHKNHLSTDVSKLKTVLFLGYVLLMLVIFPISLPTVFLLIAGLGSLTHFENPSHQKEFDFSSLLPVYLIFPVFSFVLIGGLAFLLGFKAYAAEMYFKKGLDGIAKNNLKTLYDNERQAIVVNQYIEQYRVSFAQTNLLLANNVASRNGSSTQLSEQDRQTIAQAVQAAIAEAKAAVSLNPQKAGNWENLAVIYRNILNVAQGADTWTISAYQRAIALDPQNPIYRLNLGGVYYAMNKFDDAANLFTQTASLKPNWPNAYYNLAWAQYQKGDYPSAVTSMQAVTSLISPQSDKADYDKAQNELFEFKKKLPTQASESSPSAQPAKLSIPTPPAFKISPPIKLPKTASPEAK